MKLLKFETVASDAIVADTGFIVNVDVDNLEINIGASGTTTTVAGPFGTITFTVDGATTAEKLVNARKIGDYFASLVQGRTAKWLKKQNISKWKIEYFGSRKEKQRRLSEEDMCKVYGEQWGCLMPGYEHAGSGWWRARPLQVTDAGSILIGDYNELMVLFDNEEAASVKASDLEELSDSQLTQLATLQKSSIYTKHPLNKETQQNELKKALNI